MFPKFTSSLAVACLALSLPFAALAAGKATIQGSNGDQFTLEFNGSQMRLESDKHRNMYLVANGNSVYAVTAAAGQPLVVSGNAVMGLLATQGGNRQFATGSEDIQKFVSLEPTQRQETVGGIAGTVYKLQYIDRSGKQRSEEVVLGKDADVAELTRVFGRTAATFQQNTGVDNAGAQELLQQLDSRKLGVLRFANHYRLVALDTTPPSPSRFELPTPPMQLQGLEALIPALTGRR